MVFLFQCFVGWLTIIYHGTKNMMPKCRYYTYYKVKVLVYVLWVQKVQCMPYKTENPFRFDLALSAFAQLAVVVWICIEILNDRHREKRNKIKFLRQRFKHGLKQIKSVQSIARLNVEKQMKEHRIASHRRK